MDIKSLQSAPNKGEPNKKLERAPQSLLKQIIRVTQKDIKLFKSFGEKQKAQFFSEIGVMLNAGVDLQTAFALSISYKSDTDNIYNQIWKEINNGSSLSDAIIKTGKFNNFDSYSILIGENTGELHSIFNKLNKYYQKKIIQKRKINSALSYPIIILITTVGAVYFMLKFVVPMFAETLLRFGGELPALTQFVITLSHNISSIVFSALGIFALSTIFYRKNKHNETVQNRVSSLLLKVPHVGKMVYKTHVLQFMQAMEILLNAKVTIVESMDITYKMATFYPLKRAIYNIKKDVLKGDYFYRSMQRQIFFEEQVVFLIKIGEEINQLDKIFIQLSKQYEDDLDYQSGVLISILEPIMILFLALIVAVILISMYLPMFKIGTVIK